MDSDGDRIPDVHENLFVSGLTSSPDNRDVAMKGI